MIARAFLHSPKTTWAIAGYSQQSIDTMFSQVDRKHPLSIAEFGPWNWAITKSILQHMHKDSSLTLFEINEELFRPSLEQLHATNLTIHYASCEKILEYIKPNSLDLIVSTIPLSLLSQEQFTRIIAQAHTALKGWWMFVSAQYSTYAKKLLSKHFSTIKTKRVLRNLPPSAIMICKK